ncbi:diguanylate cyclase domain-containing protein [Luethyella okanaganae]|uniref:Diguanylate cyclase domain-containing protein n=1 Tax=Luethyella okanaganae TaxID=69372 RepID=A0ABW1V9D1_9MICO
MFAYTADGVLEAESYRRVLTDWLERAGYHDEQLAMMHVALDDIGEVNVAFGAVIGESFAQNLIALTRRFASPHSIIGADGPSRLLVAVPAIDAAAARSAAETIQEGLLETPSDRVIGLRPTVSIGIALSDYLGHGFDDLVVTARKVSATAAAAGGRVLVDVTVSESWAAAAAIRRLSFDGRQATIGEERRIATPCPES